MPFDAKYPEKFDEFLEGAEGLLDKYLEKKGAIKKKDFVEQKNLVGQNATRISYLQMVLFLARLINQTQEALDSPKATAEQKSTLPTIIEDTKMALTGAVCCAFYDTLSTYTKGTNLIYASYNYVVSTFLGDPTKRSDLLKLIDNMPSFKAWRDKATGDNPKLIVDALTKFKEAVDTGKVRNNYNQKHPEYSINFETFSKRVTDIKVTVETDLRAHAESKTEDDLSKGAGAKAKA